MEPMNKIPVSTHFGMAFLNAEDIVAMNSIDGSTEVILSDDSKLTIYEPLKHFEEYVDQGLFRIHRSWIINLNRIERLYFREKCFVTVSCDKKDQNGSKIQIKANISRRRLPDIKKRFLKNA